MRAPRIGIADDPKSWRGIIKYEQRLWIDFLSKEINKWSINTQKRWSISLGIRKIQTKPQVILLPPMGMPKIKERQ